VSSRYKLLLIIIFLLVLLLVLLFFTRNRGENQDKFIEVYVQLSLAQLKFKDDPEKFEIEKEKIFSEYKFSQKELDEFLQTYRSNPERWVKLWERINQRLSELIERDKSPQSR
jgi:hypothetical protein